MVRRRRLPVAARAAPPPLTVETARTPRRARGALGLLLAVALLHCGGGADPSRPAAPPLDDAAAQGAASAASVGGEVILRVDGVEAARMTLETHGDARPIASWLKGPAATPTSWAHLSAHGEGGRTFSTRGPALRYPGTEARLYRDRDGRLSLGLFRLPEAAGPLSAPPQREPVAGLRNIATVDLHTTAAAAPADGPAPQREVSLELTRGDRVTRAKVVLAELPERALPDGRGRGWALADLLGADLDGQRLHIEAVDRNGEVASLELAAEPGDAPRYFVKRGRDGALRLQRWSAGASAHPERVLGGLQALRVQLDSP